MRYEYDYLKDLGNGGKSKSTLAHLGSGQPAPIVFWYRTSPRYMVAGQFFDEGILTNEDPALDVSGMFEMELDPQGRLVSFLAVPPQVDESPPAAKPLDANALLTAAGLDPGRFQPAEPHWTPLASSDQRAAWTGTYAQDPNPLRVEAAAWRGKLVYFALIHPWTRPERMQPAQDTLNTRILLAIGLTLLCIVVVGACLLAIHNIRLGRADWRSAFRLSGFLLLLGMVSWSLTAHHVISASEIIIFIMGLAMNAMAAVLIWVLYVALEPYVRRRWPQIIISWARVLNGQWRDPVVGGHILVGILFGALSVLLADIQLYMATLSSGVPSPMIRLGTFQSATHVASVLIGVLPSSILGTLGIFFLLFVFRLIFRKELLAAGALIVFLTAIATLASEGTPAYTIPLRLMQNGVAMYVLLRYGLFPYVIGNCVATALLVFPITADFSAWYAGSSIFTLAAIMALGAYAFYTALGGRPIFKTAFLEE
jgi:serine/threonine-protein kinase